MFFDELDVSFTSYIEVKNVLAKPKNKDYVSCLSSPAFRLAGGGGIFESLKAYPEFK